ncbi:hypothetical protein, partial [Brucella suis]|uniref:hypothetical protein n=1 Tax=Brucella suis TaxID=29461 RepID=UPI001AEBE723
EKCETVFKKDARQNKGLERRSDSIRSKRALSCSERSCAFLAFPAQIVLLERRNFAHYEYRIDLVCNRPGLLKS